jgi:hypothetical protein
MLWTIFSDEARKGMDGGETLITGGGTAAALLLKIDEKPAYKVGVQIDDSQPVDGLLDVCRSVGEKLCQHVTVTSLCIDREITIAHQIFE